MTGVRRIVPDPQTGEYLQQVISTVHATRMFVLCARRNTWSETRWAWDRPAFSLDEAKLEADRGRTRGLNQGIVEYPAAVFALDSGGALVATESATDTPLSDLVVDVGTTHVRDLFSQLQAKTPLYFGRDE